MNGKLLASILIIFIFFTSLVLAFNPGQSIDIPPTRAFMKVNVTGDPSTILTSRNYSDTLTLIEEPGINLTSFDTNNTIHIDTSFRYNSWSCSAGQFSNAGSNQTGNTSCATPSGGSNGTITTVNTFSGTVNLVRQPGNTTITNSSGTITIGIGPNVVAGGKNIGKGGYGFFSQIVTGQEQLRNLTSTNNYITVSQNTTDVNINANVPTSNVVYPLSTTIGDYTTPSSATASSACCPITTTGSVVNGSLASTTTGWNTIVWTQRYTGLTPGDTITKVGLNVATAAGNVRVKVYQNDGSNGRPSTLLGESGSNAVAGTGIQNYTVSATIPASGIVWVGFETDSGSLSLRYATSGTAVQCKVTHTYGAGPSPFGTCTTALNTDFRYYITYTHTSNSNPASSAVDGNTATYWESNNEINPWIYVDMGSAVTPVSATVYWNSTSTSTAFKAQVSTDTLTWNNVRLVNTNLLSNGAYNYFRWDIYSVNERYIRFYGNDAGAKELSIYEIKIQKITDPALLYIHGHKSISTSDGTLALGT